MTVKLITRQMVVDEARSWVGTPFKHQGRRKAGSADKPGVDCIGVIIETARALGILEFMGKPDFDLRDYGRRPNMLRLFPVVESMLLRVQIARVKPGDVLCFRIDNNPQHFGVLTAGPPAGRVVHAYAEAGRCVEHDLAGRWQRRVVRAWRFPGVTG